MFLIRPLLEEKFGKKYSIKTTVSFSYASYIKMLESKNRKTKSFGDVILFSSRRKKYIFSDMRDMSSFDLGTFINENSQEIDEIFQKMSKRLAGSHGEKFAFVHRKEAIEYFRKLFVSHFYSHLEYMREHEYFPFFRKNIKIVNISHENKFFIYLENMEDLKHFIKYFVLYEYYLFNNLKNHFSFEMTQFCPPIEKTIIYLPLLHYFKFNKIHSVYSMLVEEPEIEVAYKKNGWLVEKKKFPLGSFDLNDKKRMEKAVLQYIFRINKNAWDYHAKLLLPISKKDTAYYYQQIEELRRWSDDHGIPIGLQIRMN